jgi:hypothetical protein
VHFILTQIAPRCRRVGTFAVHAHAGVNSLRLPGRLHGRPLPPGTYVLSATVRGRPILGVTVVVTTGRPTAAEVARARARNVCGARLAFRLVTFVRPAGTKGPVGARQEVRSHSAQSVQVAVAGAPRAGGVLGTEFSPPTRGRDVSRMLLIAAAALAIVLLGMAALPSSLLADARLAAVVEHRRVELALAGCGMLLGAVIAYLTGAG